LKRILSLKPRVGTWDGKMFFPYTHANEAQNLNSKMNVVLINVKANMGMNVYQYIKHVNVSLLEVQHTMGVPTWGFSQHIIKIYTSKMCCAFNFGFNFGV
jgi:hypothetical protein